jgi:hypothetical protein
MFIDLICFIFLFFSFNNPTIKNKWRLEVNHISKFVFKFENYLGIVEILNDFGFGICFFFDDDGTRTKKTVNKEHTDF